MIGLVALGPVASADVNISPATADQGGAAELTFQVRNDRPGVFTKKVEIQFPTATPIAEVYPMSVSDWAPIATSRKLDTPVDGIHNSGLTVVTSALTWIRAENAPKAPAVENLKVQLGPLPKLNEMVLTVLQTYSDGKVVRFSGPSVAGVAGPASNGTVLRLQPPAAAAAAPADDEAVAAEPPGSGQTGSQLGLIGAGIVAGVLISALGVVTIGNRSKNRRPTEAAEEKEDVDA